MKIYEINNFNFTAKVSLNKVKHTSLVPQEINKNCSEKLYGEIDKYLSNKCSTAEYLNNFRQCYNELSSKGQLTPAEKKIR